MSKILHLNENEQLAPVRAKLAKLDAAIADVRRRKQELQEADYLRQQSAAADDAAAAQRLIDGDEIDIRSVADQIRDLDGKGAVLNRRRGNARRQADEVVAQATFEANRAILPEHKKALLELYGSLKAAGHAYKQVLAGYGKLAELDYAARLDVLPPPAFDMRAFDESFWDSGLNTFKRQLQALKVIPQQK